MIGYDHAFLLSNKMPFLGGGGGGATTWAYYINKSEVQLSCCQAQFGKFDKLKNFIIQNNKQLLLLGLRVFFLINMT